MGKITFYKQNDYRDLSEAASERVLALIQRKPDAVICLATGATPLLTYQLLVKKIKAQKTDVSRVIFVQLDEWVGIPADDLATCNMFLQRQIIQPLAITPDRYISFNCGKSNAQECLRVVRQIALHGGLDLCLLGLGKNGHLGLNEPDDMLEPDCHITQLDERTRLHEMLKQTVAPVEYGVTLGLGDILAAKEVLLLVAGDGKQQAFTAFREGKVSTRVPASFLWLHPQATCLYCKM